MTETQQRFLRSIAERVPLEHVVELHLFPPIRQGGVETGVAVVAEDPRRPVVAPISDATEPPMTSDEQLHGDVGPSSADALTERTVADAATEPAADAGEPVAVAAAGEPDTVADASLEQGDGTPAQEPNGGSNGSAVAARYTIHTARYRLTLKGVDRGKWEVDVVAEADAPLDAVDAVVRGVQRRAGEGAEPDRLSTEALRDALELTPAQLDR